MPEFIVPLPPERQGQELLYDCYEAKCDDIRVNGNTLELHILSDLDLPADLRLFFPTRTERGVGNCLVRFTGVTAYAIRFYPYVNQGSEPVWGEKWEVGETLADITGSTHFDAEFTFFAGPKLLLPLMNKKRMFTLVAWTSLEVWAEGIQVVIP